MMRAIEGGEGREGCWMGGGGETLVGGVMGVDMMARWWRLGWVVGG